VPFGDSTAIGEEIATLLTDDARRSAMRRRVYASGRSMTWPRIAQSYLTMFQSVRQSHRPRLKARSAAVVPARDGQALPPTRVEHFLSLCDDTGLLQHALHCVPDRSHGYCTDDNARALLLACRLNKLGDHQLSDSLTSRFAAFVQHAWNVDNRRFRNFLSFDRRWLEDLGSEDSHGRALWALGECAQTGRSASLRRWAVALFIEALPSVEGFSSPRAWSFALLGLDAFYASEAEDCVASRLRGLLAHRLVALLTTAETHGWEWFEESLAYDNARLSQALIVTGCATHTPTYLNAGLRSLRWLMRQQTSATGIFRPIGSQSFGAKRLPPRPFDQQPLEAAASIAACVAAWRADGDPAWRAEATRAFAWFLGSNDLASPLIDIETGSCRDGLHPDRANENRGGESAVSYLLSLAQMRELASLTDEKARLAPSRAAAG